MGLVKNWGEAPEKQEEMQMKKRILALLLVLVMIVGMLPTVALAADEAEPVEVVDGAQTEQVEPSDAAEDPETEPEPEITGEPSEDNVPAATKLDAISEQAADGGEITVYADDAPTQDADGFYQIGSKEDLIWFRNEVNTKTANKGTSKLSAKLTANIDLSAETTWEPIGKMSDTYSNYVAFGGTFDGNGFSIKLKIDTDKPYQALFGFVKNGKIQNLTVEGSVQSSDSTNGYVAGIVVYGYPVEIENCTNTAAVTITNETNKGYAAGIVAFTGSTGNRITGCTNSGKISATGERVGGIVSNASGTSISNCINSGDIVSTGTHGAFRFGVGGIAGSFSGSTTAKMERCGNTGAINSTIKRTAGIAGNFSGEVNACFNTGNITGIHELGGIVGGINAAGTVIEDCYTWGAVTCNVPNVTVSTEKSSKGVGGIVGNPTSNTYTATVKNCYNAGELKNNSTEFAIGGVIGSSTGIYYSGTTKNVITAENCYYLSSTASTGDGANGSSTITSKTGEELKSSKMPGQLGGSYVAKAGEYPILGWQDPNSKYTVTFTLAPSTAKVVVKQGETVVDPETDGSYLLKNGNYTYTVTAPECKTVTDSFTVAYSGQNFSITLEETLYDVVFTTEPTDAVLEVSGKKPLADGRTYQLPKSGNPYSYKVSAFGYEDKTGTFSVTGDAEQDKHNVVLTALAKQTVTFGAITAADGNDITPTITVACPAWPSETLTATGERTYSLPAGDYSYAISCGGYKTVKGTFTVVDKALTIPATTLEVQTAWDGENYDPPALLDGVYQIGTPNELMWFNREAQTKLGISAKLTADICINEDVNAESPHEWKPIGSSSSKAYTGTFDGDEHTISGLYINNKAANTGLFGYTAAGSVIENLTISDSKIAATGTKSNTGAFVGDLKGGIENCHTTATVSVSGDQYVGGIVGELDSGAYITECSNKGSVTGTKYVGGLAGRVYSAQSTAMTECFNTGSVTGKSFVGGLTGNLYNGGTISNCYNTGTVKATTGVAGGLVGQLRSGAIKNTYQACTVDAPAKGSVAGNLDFERAQKTLDKVYVLASGLEEVGNKNGCTIQNGTATVKTDAELKKIAADLGDKFATDEKNINGGYPILKWQNGGAAEPDPDQPEVNPTGWDGKTATQPSQTDGVWQISNAAEFKWFADAAPKTQDIKGALTADIDLNNQNWTPINKDFTGTLDGKGKSITNLYCKAANGSAALFAGNGGTLQNLTVTGKVIGSDGSAILVSENTGTITSCTTVGTVAGGGYAAGVAAKNSGTVENCVNKAAVTGNAQVAGIVAGNTKDRQSGKIGLVKGCANSGIIRASGAMTAGVVASNEMDTKVENCANNGAIISTAAIKASYVGGVVGWNDGTTDGAYNAGNVEGLGGGIGGAVGKDVSKKATQLYNIGDVTGGDYEDEGYGADNKISTNDELAQMPAALLAAKALLANKTAIGGTLTIGGTVEAGKTATAAYTDDATGLIYVWYYSYGEEGDDVVVAITDTADYTIPDELSGRLLRLKALSAGTTGVVKAAPVTVKGLQGTVRITGAPVVGRTLTAAFLTSQQDQGTLTYTWYRGTTKVGTGETYTVTADDAGMTLTVRVTSSAVPGTVQASTDTVKSADAAGLWALDQCEKPTDVGGVYVITTEKELHWFASEVNGGNGSISAKLANDIALTSENWYPIGQKGHPFSGEFDGNDKSITNLKVSRADSEVGFFGLIANGGKVHDLHVSGTVTATGDVTQTGGIAGAMSDTEEANYIRDCMFSGSVSGATQVGGIVGSVGLHNVVERCGNDATVTGTERVGGIAGANSYGNVRYCRNTGDVGGTSAKYVGGVIGDVQNYAEVLACYNTGSVTGSDYLGGVAGKVYVATTPLGCYNVGEVTSAVYSGGAFGSVDGGPYITNTAGSFFKESTTSAQTPNGAKKRTEAQMKDSSFAAELNRDGYLTTGTASGHYEPDGVSAEAQINSGYPILMWEANGSYLITLDPNGGECDQPDVRTGSDGTATLPDPYRWNYRFDGWFTDAEGGKQVTSDTAFTENTTIYAHWTFTRPSTGEKSTKHVYFSLSQNGAYMIGKDAEETLLASVPVEITWFNLADYGLEEFSVKSNGKVVEQPTMLHLMIRMLETYYLKGTKAEKDTDALTISNTSSFGSMYFTKYWGNDGNVTYYLNHAYPLMKPNWGATADYMTLEDGDVIEIGLYSDKDYWKSPDAGYAYFAKDGAGVDRLELTAREEQPLVLHRAGVEMDKAKPWDKLLANTQVYVMTDPANAEGDVTTWQKLTTTDEAGKLTVSFRQPGTYYVAAAGSSVGGPGVCIITVTGDGVSNVEKTIDALPNAEDVTAADADAIKAARAAYDALPEEDQAKVGNKDRLTQAERALAVRETEDLIDAIGDVTRDSGSAIRAARSAYDALDDAQKEQVSNRQTLFDAEKAYRDLLERTDTVAKPSVKDTAKDAAESGLPFTDVPAGSWYYDDVAYAYENGLMNGTSRRTFSPSADTTRGMIVTILARLEGVKTSGTPWYAAGQTWAMDNGVSDGTAMERSITREQFAAMLYRYAKLCGYDVTAKPASLQTFADYDSVSAYARDAMAWCVESGLIQGSSGRLAPQENATRAQVAAILTRYAQKIAK